MMTGGCTAPSVTGFSMLPANPCFLSQRLDSWSRMILVENQASGETQPMK
jgi:hypothetical protein